MRITGVLEKDDKWRKMERAYDACKEAGIEDMPQEIIDYFGDNGPSEEKETDLFFYENDEYLRIELKHVPESVYDIKIYKLSEKIMDELENLKEKERSLRDRAAVAAEYWLNASAHEQTQEDGDAMALYCQAAINYIVEMSQRKSRSLERP